MGVGERGKGGKGGGEEGRGGRREQDTMIEGRHYHTVSIEGWLQGYITGCKVTKQDAIGMGKSTNRRKLLTIWGGHPPMLDQGNISSCWRKGSGRGLLEDGGVQEGSHMEVQ